MARRSPPCFHGRVTLPGWRRVGASRSVERFVSVRYYAQFTFWKVAGEVNTEVLG